MLSHTLTLSTRHTQPCSHRHALYPCAVRCLFGAAGLLHGTVGNAACSEVMVVMLAWCAYLAVTLSANALSQSTLSALLASMELPADGPIPYQSFCGAFFARLVSGMPLHGPVSMLLESYPYAATECMELDCRSTGEFPVHSHGRLNTLARLPMLSYPL